MKPCTQPVAAVTNRDVEEGAVEAVKFLWKRKQFDERDWKLKRTRKHKTSREAGSGSVKNLTTSTFVLTTMPTKPVMSSQTNKLTVSIMPTFHT